MSTLILCIDAANDDRRRRQIHPGLRCQIGERLAVFRCAETDRLVVWLPHGGWGGVEKISQGGAA